MELGPRDKFTICVIGINSAGGLTGIETGTGEEMNDIVAYLKGDPS